MQPEDIATLTLALTAFMSGVPLNVFIMAVRFRDWVKGGQEISADLMLLFLGTINIIPLSVQCFNNIIPTLGIYPFVSLFSIYCFFTVFYSTTLSSSWIHACLSTFYCIKTVTFQHRLITYLKLRFSILLPWLLSGSILLSFSLTSLLLVVPILYAPVDNLVNNTNSSSYEQIYYMNLYINLFIYGWVAASCVPLLLSVISLGLTITSLILHVLRLDRGSPNISFTQLKAHVHAAITMTLLLILQIIYHMVLMSNSLCLPCYEPAVLWFSYTLYCYFYTLQALTLILGNRKLSLACGVFGCSPKRENIQINRD
ncbi:taste receptor type 2 member 4-like [Discoglossus pictus]